LLLMSLERFRSKDSGDMKESLELSNS